MHRTERSTGPVRHIEHLTIPVRDGTRLAARLWHPEDAIDTPVPAILEYLPYRKRDMTRWRDELHHPYFAERGYACLRVDLRGSGDSEGVLRDEYLPQELEDGEDVIAWIADQPWCDGNVGIIGISWGGFNGLQLAARRPPALRAVITVASTDDRYSDDVHYMGGCLLGDNLSWASTMFAYNSLPPDPELVPDWRERWSERLEGSGLWLETWLEHQHRDEYWRHGSVAQADDGHTAIQVPVMAVSGWADGYSNAVFRLLERLEVPRQGLIGPWSHKYPHIGTPGPAIGWLQQCVRWWDRWLKGIENGIEDEPMLRAWMQDSMPPFTQHEQRNGRWIAEKSWPSPGIDWSTFHLVRARLVPSREGFRDERGLVVHSPLSLGLFAGKWASYAGAPDMPGDQQEEDGGALVFDSDPLPEDLEVLGPVIVELELSSDQPVAMVAVRLSDVRPDREAARTTYGLLNLTHRNSHEHPEPLVPGKRYRIRLQLNDIGQVFPAGHHLRLAISTSYWPLAWLPPEPTQLTVYPHGSQIHVPVRHPRSEPEVTFEPPEMAPPMRATTLEARHGAWRVIRDLGSNATTLEVIKDAGEYRIDDLDLTVAHRAVERYTVIGSDTSSAEGTTTWERSLQRGDWRVRTVTTTTLTCDPTDFHLHATLDAYEGDRRVHAANWNRTIPRRLV